MGKRLGGMPTFSLENKFITSPQLSMFQRNCLQAAHQHIRKVHGTNLQPTELYNRVANLFNQWHLAMFATDMVGHGGMISAERVQKEFRLGGSTIIQGNLGLRPTAQLHQGIQQHQQTSHQSPPNPYNYQ